MSFFAIIIFIFSGICLLSAWASFRYAGGLFASLYSLLMLCTGYWQLCSGLTISAPSAEQAQIWSRLAYLGAMFIPMLMFELTRHSAQIKIPKKLHISLYAATFALLGIFLYTDRLLAGVHHFAWGYWFKAGPWHFLFCVLYSVVLVLFPIFLLWRSREDSFSWPVNRRSFVHRLAYAFFIGDLGAIDFLPDYGFNVFPLGVVFAGICYFLITRLFLEHGLFKSSLVPNQMPKKI